MNGKDTSNKHAPYDHDDGGLVSVCKYVFSFDVLIINVFWILVRPYGIHTQYSKPDICTQVSASLKLGNIDPLVLQCCDILLIFLESSYGPQKGYNHRHVYGMTSYIDFFMENSIRQFQYPV